MASNSSKEFSMMGVFKTFALGAGLALGLAATAGAEELRVRVYEGSIAPGNLLTGGPGYSNTGLLVDNSFNANFTNVSVTLQGVPLVPSPNLSTIAISATSGNITGPTTLIVVMSQQDLSSTDQTLLRSTFTGNTLAGAGYTTFTIENYINANNSAFGTTTLIGSTSYSNQGAGSFSSAAPDYLAPADTSWSEVIIYTITFTAANQSISASSAITAVVPEPMSMALLGAGLLGLAAVRRRKA